MGNKGYKGAARTRGNGCELKLSKSQLKYNGNFLTDRVADHKKSWGVVVNSLHLS